MARHKISKRDGTATQYFWSDRDGTDEKRKSVYRQADDGVKRMRGVRYDSTANRIRKD